jgi:molybdopterin synthase catalytic subunit
MSDRNTFVQIVDGPIETASLQGKLSDPDVGAHGWFYGVTRRKTTRDEVTKITQSLSYEAHRPMALSQLEQLADQAAEKFNLPHVVIVHRLGEVPIGQASVVVGCSSAHRIATFDANQWIMDMIKRDVPIWKQELFEDGSREWVHPSQANETKP